MKEKSVNLKAVNEHGHSGLHVAIEKKRVDNVQVLLEHPSTDVNALDKDRMTPLCKAVQMQTPDIVKKLLALNNLVIATGTDVCFPLHLAANFGHVEITKMLLQLNKINVNQLDRHGISALSEAVRQNQAGVVRLLLDDPNLSQDSTTLHLAVRSKSNDLSTLKALLSHPLIDPNCKLGGETPMHAAVRANFEKGLRQLLEHPFADPFLLNQEGHSAISLAKELNNHKALAEICQSDKMTRFSCFLHCGPWLSLIKALILVVATLAVLLYSLGYFVRRRATTPIPRRPVALPQREEPVPAIPIQHAQVRAPVPIQRGRARTPAMLMQHEPVPGNEDAGPPPEVDFGHCDICADDDEKAVVTTNPTCKHRFCFDCIQRQLDSQLDKGVTATRCLEATCLAVISETVLSYIGSPQSLFRRAIMMAGQQAPLEPVNINLLDSATRAILVRTTKQCPKCRTAIEKNDGCDHMTCKSCSHEFCWLCLADYAPIRQQGNHTHRAECAHFRAIGA